MATVTVVVPLPVNSAHLSSGFIAIPARIDGGQNARVLKYSATQTESAVWQLELESGYDTGSMSLRAKFRTPGDTTNSITLKAKVKACTDDVDNTETDNFDTQNAASGVTVPSVADEAVTAVITLTNEDSAEALDLIFIHLERDHDDGGDDASGDLELLTLYLIYTITVA